jgi:hypothetical protein
MHQPLSLIACLLNTAQHVSDILMPIIRSLSTAVAASGLTLERGGSTDRLRPTTFALQLREKHGKTSVRVARECQIIVEKAVSFYEIQIV